MFDKNTIASITSSIRAGQYNLLLGAGVSLDSKNPKGFLPSAEQFRLDLCQFKGARTSSSLQRVFSTLNSNEIATQVVSRFQNCTPGPSVQKIPKFLWRRIFTFNIDDALEAAYKADQTYQLSRIFHFEDDYTEITEPSEVPIVHLHGWVGMPEHNYVFALSEYVRQIRAINPWMVVLTQFMRVEPFIIAGTSLDEIDLEYYLAHRTSATSRSDRGPSILVDPSPDSVTRRDCEKYGLLLFNGTADKFWDYIDSSVPNRPTPIEHTPKNLQNLFPAIVPKRSIVSFSADFELVPDDALQNKAASRFLFGHPPTWEDLSGNQDIPRKLTTTIIQRIESRITSPILRERLLFLMEGPGVGKTTLLKRIAFELAHKKIIKVLMCSALGRIDAQRTAELIDLIDAPLLVIVDNIGDHANAIADTADRLEKKDVVILCAEREYRSRYVKNAFSKLGFEIISGLNLDTADGERLIASYLHFGMLGNADAAKKPEAFARQIQGDPIAVAACRILNDFKPLSRIIKSISADTNERDRARYLIAALAHFCFRGGVRYEVLASISGREGWDDQFDPTHPMPLDYLDSSDRSYVVPLNATLSSAIFTHICKESPEQVFRAFVTLGNALAPYVNRGAIRRRSPEARLAGLLFDYDGIVRDFLGDSAVSFYDEIRELWQWNSRYWEQLALLYISRYHSAPSTEYGRDALIQAVQHARHAVSIEVHPFTLTTLGAVLFAQLSEDTKANSSIYEEAIGRLSDAIDRERNWSYRNPHSFMSLFTGTKRYVDFGGNLTSRQKDYLKQAIGEAQKLFQRDSNMTDAISKLAPYLV